LAIAIAAPSSAFGLAVVAGSLLSLAALGAVAARAGGAEMARGSLRLLFWGALAMGVTAGVGRLFRGVPYSAVVLCFKSVFQASSRMRKKTFERNPTFVAL
jgi:hypothetical protein